MPTRQRITTVVGMFTASNVVAGSVLLGGTLMTPDITGPLDIAHRNVKLVDITGAFGTFLVPWPDPTLYPTLGQMEKFVLDAFLGIGQQTLPKFMDPNGTTPLNNLFVEWDKWTGDTLVLGGPMPSNLNDVFNLLGLQNIDVTTLLTSLGLAPGDEFSVVLTKLGLDTVTLDQLMTGLNVGDVTTVAALIDNWGMGSNTVGTLLTELGVDNGVTVDGLMTGLGLGQLEGFLPLMGLTTTTPAWSALATLTGSTITSNTTLDTLLGSGGLFGTIGSMTLGQLLGFTDTTTISDVLNGLTFDLGGTSTALGDFTITDLLGQVTWHPGDSLAAILGSLPLGAGGATDLGTTTLAEFLTVIDGGIQVTDTTTITEFLESIPNANLGTTPIDTLLGLDSVDISNWFIPA